MYKISLKTVHLAPRNKGFTTGHPTERAACALEECLNMVEGKNIELLSPGEVTWNNDDFAAYLEQAAHFG